jgi:DNA-binding XRE family transcriptional regulator
MSHDPDDRYDTAITILTQLPDAVINERALRDLSQQQAAAHIGISRSSLLRIEAGRDTRLHTALKVLEWIQASRTSDQVAP